MERLLSTKGSLFLTSAAQWLRDFPALWIAGLTVYFYLVAASYFGGFVSFFGAESHWFNPSVLQLAQLSKSGLFASALVAASTGVVVLTASRSGWVWWPIAVLSVPLMLLYCIVAVAANTAYGHSWATQKWVLLLVPLQIVSALLIRHSRYWSSEAPRHLKVQLEEAVGFTDRLRARAKFDPAVADPKAALAAIDTLEEFLRTSPDFKEKEARYYVIVGVLGPLIGFVFASFYFGRYHGLTEYQQLLRMRDASPDAQITQLIITDGTASLLRVVDEGEIRTVFSSPHLSQDIQLWNRREHLNMGYAPSTDAEN